jgi:hypothetical protein
MMGKDLLHGLRTLLLEFGSSLLQFLPRLLAALLILVFGWLCATLLRAMTRRALSWARFDRIMERAGGGDLLKRTGLGRPHALVGTAVYWLTWVAILLAAMKVLRISGTETLVADFVRLLPSVGVAFVVFIIGFALASVAWRVALLAAVNARLNSAKLLAAVVRGLVLVASFAMAFEQLNIGRGVLHTTFAIVFGALMLAVAIAFGLGGRHAARRFVEERLLASGKKDDDASHL